MGFFTYIAFAGSLACFALGSYVLRANRPGTMPRLFAAICFTLSVLNMVSLPAYNASEKDSLYFWTQVASVNVNAFYAVNLHFYLVLLLKKKPRVPLLIGAYSPALFIIVIYAANPLLILDYVQYGGQWKLIPAYDSVWFYLASGQVVLYTAATVAVIIRFAAGARTNKERLQAKWLMVNLALSTIIGVLGMWVIPFFKPDVPNVGPTYHLPYVAGLYFAVFRFRMMDFRPSIVADEIITHISDMVFILDREMNVISANARCAQLISFDLPARAGTNFTDLIMDWGTVGSSMQSLGENGLTGINRLVIYRGKEEPVETDSYISKVFDDFGDLSGYLVISRENRGRQKFSRTYKISDREMQIIDLTIEGLTSAKIARLLGISQRTVQSHQEHIYQKLGAESKVDLIRIAHEFNIGAKI